MVSQSLMTVATLSSCVVVVVVVVVVVCQTEIETD